MEEIDRSVGLLPSGGQITISISKLNSYNYINGFTLTENATGTTSAASSSFLADSKSISTIESRTLSTTFLYWKISTSPSSSL